MLSIVGYLSSCPGSPWTPVRGVGHIRAASVIVAGPFQLAPFALPNICASGVGHILAAPVSVVPECLPLSVEYAAAPEEASSFVVAVGEHEEPLATVRRSNVGRS